MTPSDTRPIAILYKGHSDFDSLNTMVDHWAGALARRQFRPEIVDLRAPDAIARTVALIRSNRVALFLSLNGYGVPEQDAGFYRETTAPLIVVFVDHPLYHLSRLGTGAPRMVAAFPTPHHVELCRTRLRTDLPVFHLPHAAAPGQGCPWAERDIPVLLSGSLHEDPEQARTRWLQHGTTVRERLEAILAAHRAAPRRPLHELVLEVLDAPGLPPPLLASYFTLVDAYLRSHLRVAFLEAAGALPLTVLGRGWDAVVPARSRIRLLGEQPAAAVFGLMARSRIVLNLLPAYYESHERPFQAMAQGAVAATVAAPWLLEAVGADALLALPPDPAAAATQITGALDGGAALAARGTAAFLAGHTWDHRLNQLFAATQDTVAISASRSALASGR